MLAHAFETLCLPVIVAGHGMDHVNSRKLVERTGFTYTHNALWGPKQIELCMWSITAKTWEELRVEASSFRETVTSPRNHRLKTES